MIYLAVFLISFGALFAHTDTERNGAAVTEAVLAVNPITAGMAAAMLYCTGDDQRPEADKHCRPATQEDQ